MVTVIEKFLQKTQLLECSFTCTNMIQISVRPILRNGSQIWSVNPSYLNKCSKLYYTNFKKLHCKHTLYINPLYVFTFVSLHFL